MKPGHSKAAAEGDLIKTQTFETRKGTYELDFIRYRGNVYFFKSLNGKLVESCNLNAMKGLSAMKGESGNE